jgi:deoxyribonuclease V
MGLSGLRPVFIVMENPAVRVRQIHRWDLTPREASALQLRLRRRVRQTPFDPAGVRRVAGCDCAIGADSTLVASAVLIDAASLEVIEVSDARVPLAFPYVPGLLSFREVPGLLRAFEGLRLRPDIVLCDGQGRAHPRRFGLASHLGLLLGLPTIGVAKSRLIGEAAGEPRRKRGSWVDLTDGGEVIGRVLRTRDGVNPLYISVGHRVTLDDAVALVLATGGGYRIPEPTRLADRRVRALARSALEVGSMPAAIGVPSVRIRPMKKEGTR